MRFDDSIGTSAPAHEDLYDRWYRETAPTHDDMIAVATQSGIADVDPEPLSQVVGEGIDPMRDPAAHNEIIELRDRLPR